MCAVERSYTFKSPVMHFLTVALDKMQKYTYQ